MRIRTKTTENFMCIYCRSNKVIRHGKTSTGKPRYRCRQCGRTWVQEKTETVRPDIESLVEAYLSGRTFRDLVEIYKSSPLRINKKIREFLANCPHWEEYLDVCVPKHYVKLAFLVGRTFAAATKQKNEHRMFLAMAIDALSNVVLGFEISEFDNFHVWYTLLSRMKDRGIECPTFMTNGSVHIEEALSKTYSSSNIRLLFHRGYRDREISCCLSRLQINQKLFNDAIVAFQICNNQNLNRYLKMNNNKYFEEILRGSTEFFCRRLRERMENKNKIRIEGIYNAFQTRFEKFHMLKSDPFPLANGWIALRMTQILEIGFSRLSIYMQIPATTSLKLFSCGQAPQIQFLTSDSPKLKNFIIEVSARALQLPIFYNRCEMKLDRCSLY